MIHKYPFIRQSGYKDCAAACLYMIIRYYKGFVRISKLEEMLKTTKRGTTAYHMVRALENLGFAAYGFKDKKIVPTNIPFIVHVIIEGSYTHYMVVYEVTKKYIKAADPASRIRKLSYDEFFSIWTGISIEMYPKDVITYEKSKEKIKLFMLNKKLVVIIGLISTVITVLSIILSFFFQFLIDNDSIKSVVLIFLFLTLIKIILNYIREKLFIGFTCNIEKDITKKVFESVIKLPYRYYHNHTSGEIISKINDLTVIQDVVLKLMVTCFTNVPLALTSAFILFCFNSKLFVITLFILLLYILIVFLYHRKIDINIYETLGKKSKVNSFMTECINGFESVKGIDIEDNVIRIFNEKYDNYIMHKAKLGHILNRQSTLKDFVGSYGTMAILITGILFVHDGVISLSMLITYNILVSFFLEPFKNVIDLDLEIKEAKNVLNRIYALVEVNNEKSCVYKKGDIVINNLSYSFDDFKYILKRINITIKEKSKVLITGKSGSGKSTLLKLIKGYYTDFEGNLLIGGKRASNLKRIVYVSNKEILFTGTIDYNLRLKGDNDIDEKVRLCLIDDLINSYSLKENTLLEEDGFNVSAGQKQRLVLARSLYDFDILLIDEGLNAVDINLERKILKNLFYKYKDKTILFVSHHIENLDLFDQYIKLDDGQVIFSSFKA